jgi:hypothetical protein
MNLTNALVQIADLQDEPLSGRLGTVVRVTEAGRLRVRLDGDDGEPYEFDAIAVRPVVFAIEDTRTQQVYTFEKAAENGGHYYRSGRRGDLAVVVDGFFVRRLFDGHGFIIEERTGRGWRTRTFRRAA